MELLCSLPHITSPSSAPYSTSLKWADHLQPTPLASCGCITSSGLPEELGGLSHHKGTLLGVPCPHLHGGSWELQEHKGRSSCSDGESLHCETAVQEGQEAPGHALPAPEVYSRHHCSSSPQQPYQQAFAKINWVLVAPGAEHCTVNYAAWLSRRGHCYINAQASTSLEESPCALLCQQPRNPLPLLSASPTVNDTLASRCFAWSWGNCRDQSKRTETCMMLASSQAWLPTTQHFTPVQRRCHMLPDWTDAYDSHFTGVAMMTQGAGQQ